MLLLVVLMLPPVLIYRARGMTSRAPRLHIVPDMDWQYKYEAQEIGPTLAEGRKIETKYLFPYERAAQAQLRGTVSRQDIIGDSELLTGIAKDNTVPNANAIPTSLRRQEPASGESQEKKEKKVPEPKWLTKFPEAITVTDQLLARGRERFNIYCSVCRRFEWRR